MPHYKDGVEAKLGDKVKGKPYNTHYEIVGEVIGITPGSDLNWILFWTKRERESKG